MTIEVSADDQSGVQSVDLLCDGQRLGQATITPYVWTQWPGNGYHTYQALAVDASAQANTRSSFKRTILVGPQEGSTAAPVSAK